MFRPSTIQLARVFGIRIGVDSSWFLVLFFFIFLLSGSFRDATDSSDTVAYLTAVASALSFFASLVLHELGHALVARRLGIGIAGIDLWFFGGIAKMEKDTESPGQEFKVAIAGPVVTLLVVAACVGAGIAIGGSQEFYDAATLDSGAGVSPGLLLLSWLATINIVLFVFNLIPAFPLDGGRVARAVAWKVTGDKSRGTRFAASIGQGFAYLLMGFGLAELIFGNSLSSGLWLMFLGWFLGSAARGAVAQTHFSDRLKGLTVADVMDPEPVAIPATMPVSQALDEFFLRYRWPWFPVVDESSRFIGVLTQVRADEELAAGRPALSARDAMAPDDGNDSVGTSSSLESVLGSEALRRLGGVVAVDPDGVLRGVVTIDRVRRALQGAVATPTS
jgi:Zn-dependent protease